MLYFKNSIAQTSPCAGPQHGPFDLWIGQWQLTWQTRDGNLARGSNRFEKIMNGCVIRENFDGNPGMTFRGLSLSIFDKNIKKWRRTWVDDQGGYLEFSGGMEGDRMMRARKAEKDGNEFLQRMIFYNISTDSLDRDWQRWSDGGPGWKFTGQIH